MHKPIQSEFFRFETQTKLFTDVANKIIPNEDRFVADYGCGFGRHALQLLIKGHKVIAIDNDHQRLGYIKKYKDPYLSSLHIKRDFSKIKLLGADLINYPIPFQDCTLAGAICVHFPEYEFIKKITSSIMPGGFLLFETFDGHGLNYEKLPESGYIKQILESFFDLNVYIERHVGPTNLDRVSVRVFGQKKIN